MADTKKNMTSLVLTFWLVVLSTSSIFVAVKFKDARAEKVTLEHTKQELDARKQELDEWEADLTAREEEWRHGLDLKGSDGIPPPVEDDSSKKRHPRKIEIPPSQ